MVSFYNGKKPKISVIIPTYNRVHFLQEAIESVFRQTFQDYEIIVIDDGSSDNTKEMISKLGHKIRYFYQDNRGRSSARNHGIQMARGEYIAFLDSDDVFLPEKNAIQVKALDDNPEYGIVYSHALTMDEKGNPLGMSWQGNLSGWIYPMNLFIKNCLITTPTVMVRANVLKHIGGFDENMHMCEDLDLWRRIARLYPVLHILSPLVKVRLANDVVKNGINVKTFLCGREEFYRKAFREDPSIEKMLKKDLFSEMYSTYGMLALQQKKIMYATLLFLKTIKYNPGTTFHVIRTALRKVRDKIMT